MHETFVSKPDLPECFFDEIMEEPLEGDIVLMNNLVIKRATAVTRWETGKHFGTFSSQLETPFKALPPEAHRIWTLPCTPAVRLDSFGTHSPFLHLCLPCPVCSP